MSCPVCCNNIFEDLIDFGMVPQTGVFLSNVDEEYKKIHLLFEFCNKCGFIKQKEKIIHDYKEDKERTWQKLPDYASEIINSFKEKNKEELVFEIGSNVGLFLDALKENGFNNILGIEPSTPASEISRNKGYKTENSYFDKNKAEEIKEKYGLSEIVVVRHVLEHIEEPFEFLLSVKDLLKEDGMLFLEVPNAKNIISNLRAQELWDEHFSYFSSDNLKLLLNRAGFKVDKVLIKPYFGEEAVLLWCSKSKDKNEVFCEEYVKECRSFEKRLKEFYDDLLEKVKNSKKPIIGIGAAHKQTNLLVFSGIGEYIDKLIDDDKYKIKKYVPVPKLIPIISTEDFFRNDFSGTIIRTAFGFENWMDKICNGKDNIIEIFS